ncbi:hypothetical protein RCZ04_23180 [Capnocytophaga sp. HP1101]
MKNIILSIGLVLTTVVLSAQNVFQASGERSIRKIAVQKYTKIDIDNRWDITLVNEKNDHIYIDADDAIHPIIKTTVQEGTLRVSLETPNGVNFVQTGGIKLKIPVKGTSELNMKSGKLRTEAPIKMPSYKMHLDFLSEIHLNLNIDNLDLKIGSCKEGNLQLNCRNLTFEAGSLDKLPISGKVENLTFVSNSIIQLQTYDLTIQNAIFNTSGIVKAKLRINGAIQGKPTGIFELYYKGNATNEIAPHTMIKIIKEKE